mgnify:CR=1 FL=1
MNENKNFKPVVPAHKRLPEFTPVSLMLGLLLAVVFGAANAYLGLRVGMTVSATLTRRRILMIKPGGGFVDGHPKVYSAAGFHIGE